MKSLVFLFFLLVAAFPLAAQSSCCAPGSCCTKNKTAMTGPTIESVLAGSPAEKAGLRTGDRLLAVGNQSSCCTKQTTNALEARAVGERVLVRFERGGQVQETSVQLEAQPDDAACSASQKASWLGVKLAEAATPVNKS